MTQIIDSDNLTARILKPGELDFVKSLLRLGKVKDVCGDVLNFDDVIDGHGDLCFDEDSYDTVTEALDKK